MTIKIKNMKFKFTIMKSVYYLFLTLAFISCTEQDDLNLITRLNRDKKNTKYDNILDYVNYIKNGNKKSRSTSTYTVNPYLNDNGDTIAYVVNYDDGWDLLSNDRRAPLVLASSSVGNFNINQIEQANNLNDYWSDIEKSLTKLKSVPTSENDTLGQGWNALYVQNGSVKEEDIVKTKATFNETYPGTNGYWVLLESETRTISDEISSRVITNNWHQDLNSFIPQKQNEQQDSVHCKVGCVAVAGGQYLYYLHERNNNPRYMVDNVTYNHSTKTYSFSGNSENVWQYMTNILYGDYYVSIMLGYIASEIDMNFGINKSTVNEMNLSNFINRMYGYNFSWYPYSASTIINKLKQMGAVVAVADGYDYAEQENCAHAFLIDGYRVLTTETTSTYGWVGEDNLGQDTNDRDPGGNIVGYGFITTQTEETTTSTIYMNWGQSITLYNNIGFNVYATNWTMGDAYFNTNKMILY